MRSLEKLQQYLELVATTRSKGEEKLKLFVEGLPDAYDEVKVQLPSILQSNVSVAQKTQQVSALINANKSNIHRTDYDLYQAELSGISILLDTLSYQLNEVDKIAQEIVQANPQELIQLKITSSDAPIFSILENMFKSGGEPTRSHAAYLLAFHHARISGHGKIAVNYFSQIAPEYMLLDVVWEKTPLVRFLRDASNEQKEKIWGVLKDRILNVFERDAKSKKYKYLDINYVINKNDFISILLLSEVVGVSLVINKLKEKNSPDLLIAVMRDVFRAQTTDTVSLQQIETVKKSWVLQLLSSELPSELQRKSLSEIFPDKIAVSTFFNKLSSSEKAEFLLACRGSGLANEKLKWFAARQMLLQAVEELQTGVKREGVTAHLGVQQREEIINYIGSSIVTVVKDILDMNELSQSALPYFENLIRSIIKDPLATHYLSEEQFAGLIDIAVRAAEIIAEAGGKTKPDPKTIKLHLLVEVRDGYLSSVESKNLSEEQLHKIERNLINYVMREFNDLQNRGFVQKVVDRIFKAVSLRKSGALEEQVMHDKDLPQDDPLRLFNTEFVLRLLMTQERLPSGFEPLKEVILNVVKEQDLDDDLRDALIKGNNFSIDELASIIRFYRDNHKNEQADLLVMELAKAGREMRWEMIKDLGFRQQRELAKIILGDTWLIADIERVLKDKQKDLIEIKDLDGLATFIKDLFSASFSTSQRVMDQRSILAMFVALIETENPDFLNKLQSQASKNLLRLVIKAVWHKDGFLANCSAEWIRYCLRDDILVRDWIVREKPELGMMDRNGYKVFKRVAELGLFEVFFKSEQEMLKEEFKGYIPRFITDFYQLHNADKEKNIQLAKFLLSNDELVAIASSLLRSRQETFADIWEASFGTSRREQLKRAIKAAFETVLEVGGPNIFENKSEPAKKFLRQVIQANWYAPNNFVNKCGEGWIKYLLNDKDFVRAWIVAEAKDIAKAGSQYVDKNGDKLFERVARMGLLEVFYESSSDPSRKILKPELVTYIPHFITDSFKESETSIAVKQLESLQNRYVRQGFDHVRISYLLDMTHKKDTPKPAKDFIQFNLLKNSADKLRAMQKLSKYKSQINGLVFEVAKDTKNIAAIFAANKGNYAALANIISVLNISNKINDDRQQAIVEQVEKELGWEIKKQKRYQKYPWAKGLLRVWHSLWQSDKPQYVVRYEELKDFAAAQAEDKTKAEAEEREMIAKQKQEKQEKQMLLVGLPTNSDALLHSGNFVLSLTLEDVQSEFSDLKAEFQRLSDENFKVLLAKIKSFNNQPAFAHRKLSMQAAEILKQINEIRAKRSEVSELAMQEIKQLASLTKQYTDLLKEISTLERRIQLDRKLNNPNEPDGDMFHEYSNSELESAIQLLHEIENDYFKVVKNEYEKMTDESWGKSPFLSSLNEQLIKNKKLLASAMLKRLEIFVGSYEGYIDSFIDFILQNGAPHQRERLVGFGFCKPVLSNLIANKNYPTGIQLKLLKDKNLLVPGGDITIVWPTSMLKEISSVLKNAMYIMLRYNHDLIKLNSGFVVDGKCLSQIEEMKADLEGLLKQVQVSDLYSRLSPPEKNIVDKYVLVITNELEKLNDLSKEVLNKIVASSPVELPDISSHIGLQDNLMELDSINQEMMNWMREKNILPRAYGIVLIKYELYGLEQRSRLNRSSLNEINTWLKSYLDKQDIPKLEKLFMDVMNNPGLTNSSYVLAFVCLENMPLQVKKTVYQKLINDLLENPKERSNGYMSLLTQLSRQLELANAFDDDFYLYIENQVKAKIAAGNYNLKSLQFFAENIGLAAEVSKKLKELLRGVKNNFEHLKALLIEGASIGDAFGSSDRSVLRDMLRQHIVNVFNGNDISHILDAVNTVKNAWSEIADSEFKVAVVESIKTHLFKIFICLKNPEKLAEFINFAVKHCDEDVAARLQECLIGVAYDPLDLPVSDIDATKFEVNVNGYKKLLLADQLAHSSTFDSEKINARREFLNEVYAKLSSTVRGFCSLEEMDKGLSDKISAAKEQYCLGVIRNFEQIIQEEELHIVFRLSGRYQLGETKDAVDLYAKLLAIEVDIKRGKLGKSKLNFTTGEFEKSLAVVEATRKALFGALSKASSQLLLDCLQSLADYEVAREKRRIKMPKFLGGKYKLRGEQLDQVRDLYIYALKGVIDTDDLIGKLKNIQKGLDKERLRKTSRLLKILAKQINTLIRETQVGALGKLHEPQVDIKDKDISLEADLPVEVLNNVFVDVNNALLSIEKVYQGNNFDSHLNDIRNAANAYLKTDAHKAVNQLDTWLQEFEKTLRDHESHNDDKCYGVQILKVLQPVLREAKEQQRLLESRVNYAELSLQPTLGGRRAD